MKAEKRNQYELSLHFKEKTKINAYYRLISLVLMYRFMGQIIQA